MGVAETRWETEEGTVKQRNIVEQQMNSGQTTFIPPV